MLDGKYRVVEVLGKGGMSIVYLCENIRLGNLWAVKEVQADLKYQVDFLTEPNILKKLNHRGIPRIIDIFYEEDNLYIVEDYIKGRTLDEIIKSGGPLDTERSCSIADGICEILEYLHSFDPPIIYRDLKPQNIMFGEDGRVVLIDFGISRTYKKGQREDTVFMGSRGYAAPEQFGNSQSRKQTDIYGLGATLYFMVLGRAPINISEPLRDEPYGNNIDPGLREIIKKAMQIDMDKRFENAAELRDALKNVLIKKSSTRILGEVETSLNETEGENLEKTRFLNMQEAQGSQSTGTVKAEGKSFDKTVPIGDKKPSKKRRTAKRVLAALVLILVYLGCAKLLAAMGNKETPKPPANKAPVEVKADDSKIKIENLNRDEVVEGIIYRKSPLMSKTLLDSKTTEKGKGKGKKEDKEEGDSKINYLLYEVVPQAEVRKYNKNIIFKLERIEVVNDILVTYITISNYSDRKISLSYDNTAVSLSDGRTLSLYSSLSTDISSISAGETKKSIKIVFKGFSMNTDFIKLNTNIKIDDPLYSNRAVNLRVNIK